MDNLPLGVFLRNKWVRIVLIIDALLLVAIIAFMIIGAMRTSILVLNITPVDAKILVNGKEYSNGTYSFKSGEYEIVISHEALETKSLSINLESGHNLTVATFLKPESNDFAYYTLKGNFDSFSKLEEIASSNNNLTYDSDHSAETFISSFRKKYDALLEALPIEHQEYTNTVDGRELTKDITIKMNSDAECKTFVCLKALMLGTDNQSMVKSLMLEKGLKAEDYEIYYKIY